MKSYIIFNPIAGSVSNRDAILLQLSRLKPVKLRLTRKAGDAEKWAREALRTESDLVVVVGGDGTLNEVVNGLANRARRVRIGIVPMGTGNDFARTLGLPSSLEDNVDLLKSPTKTTRVDVVRVRVSAQDIS